MRIGSWHRGGRLRAGTMFDDGLAVTPEAAVTLAAPPCDGIVAIASSSDPA